MEVVEFKWRDEDGENKVVCNNFEEVSEFCRNNYGKNYKVSSYERY